MNVGNPGFTKIGGIILRYRCRAKLVVHQSPIRHGDHTQWLESDGVVTVHCYKLKTFLDFDILSEELS